MRQRGLWWRGLLWLGLLGPLFFLIYTPINQYTATRADVGHWVWAWEQHIPFWPWTIVPYWSENILYGLSLFICTQRREQTMHALRLLAASLLAAVGFLVWPLRYTFERPLTDGLFGTLFAQLETFDLPFNQAPSLHIILAWLLWLRYQAHVPKPSPWRFVVHTWALLIALSVLTTWQHHFIDVLWGAVAGVVISYALPIGRRWQWRVHTDPKAQVLRHRYGIATLVLGLCTHASLWWPFWPLTFLLAWITLDLALLTLAYWRLGHSIYQKNAEGKVSLSAKIVLAPFRIGAWAVVCWFNRRISAHDEIHPGLFVGKYPNAEIRVAAVLDMTAKWDQRSYPKHIAYVSCPRLDLVTPTLAELAESVQQLDTLHQQYNQVLVHCALGMSRSALVAAGWLLYRGHSPDVASAVAQLQQARPVVFLRPEHVALLVTYIDAIKETA